MRLWVGAVAKRIGDVVEQCELVGPGAVFDVDQRSRDQVVQCRVGVRALDRRLTSQRRRSRDGVVKDGGVGRRLTATTTV